MYTGLFDYTSCSVVVSAIEMEEQPIRNIHFGSISECIQSFSVDAVCIEDVSCGTELRFAEKSSA